MGIFSRIFGKTSQKSDDMVWADEFTLQMGLEFDDLFGIFAMPQSFADAPRLLKKADAAITRADEFISKGNRRYEEFLRSIPQWKIMQVLMEFEQKPFR